MLNEALDSLKARMGCPASHLNPKPANNSSMLTNYKGIDKTETTSSQKSQHNVFPSFQLVCTAQT